MAGITYEGSGLVWDGLASEDFQLISITVSGDTTDAGNVNKDDLRAGLTLCYDSTKGKYVEFSSGNEDTLVVLAENLYDLADTGDQVAKAFIRATFKKGKVIETDTVDWTEAQRFIILPY